MILDGYETFIGNSLKQLHGLGIDVSKLDMDHLGYQSSSANDYEQLKSQFDQLGKFISEEIVNGRRVGIYQLNEPLHYQQFSPRAIELIEPKPGQECLSALEHIEFVLPQGFEAFMKQYPAIPWDTSALHQPKFPMLKLKLNDHTQVKFHLTPVLKIVEK